MKIDFKYGKDYISLNIPKDSCIYLPSYELVHENPGKIVLDSIANPISSKPLNQQLHDRRKGNIVIVVSDITRPIPYRLFLPELIKYIMNEGIRKEEIIILVATGMHRASTAEEKIEMFGKGITDNIRIIDHDAENESNLASIEGKSWSGTEVKLNRYYVEAGFRILTGLVEPHFMAGFSGGRKSVCPGLASLNTIQKFHGYTFLSNPNASNTNLENNPCHLENSSIARICPADFLINIILDQNRQINKVISGDQFLSYDQAVAYVIKRSCKEIDDQADTVITSCSGYPLDTTFYQCVKGFVNCLPALKEKGKIIAFGSCTEGIGSHEYKSIMKKYFLKYNEFLTDIKEDRFFIKDQWQFQMHIKVLDRIGIQNLHFYTAGIPEEELKLLSVHPHAFPMDKISSSIQQQLNKEVASGKRLAVFPEGPYCSPIDKQV